MEIDNNKEHYCPVYDKIISSGLCYDSMLCLAGFFTISSVEELHSICDVENARTVCDKCPYSET